MKVHYPKLYNMANLSLNVFTASKGSNNYILFHSSYSYTSSSMTSDHWVGGRAGLEVKM